MANISVPRSQSHSRPPGLRPVAKTVKPVNFVCVAPAAKKVTLVGDFNDWHPDAQPLKRQPDGSWTGQITLGHGHHHYQFLVDGKPTLDPRAQGIARNEANEKVSLLAVS
ncbi:MAG TPA: isoamylase early set domain-containing protein [Verrucomicrobiae bacterium]|jgi:1,4-alpha-glucan branching enzyme|nr:isoamylase early set domain-containing protein [Verrucomicrobiae bacterium]